ncbi:TetR/AcrR family transcriptional regulator [Desulfosarcina ovata]|uniref:HTH tetR-type domain-containing protein n=2 Tax=Desulfosarcina ovata TaxID=83564 RepID=A0A5K8AFQ0_9BACT|nr:TetR/AcrR family transcriptional regulator [Desulfosarcina ovata]BBO84837.1 hypothetical protein DSCO28_54030 [Desulfosarcina ovata subsp. sediminis]BBO91326.1 hypothetical protein DSCOOX_45060 [Desulfosarcina ovata subsp. ovata]
MAKLTKRKLQAIKTKAIIYNTFLEMVQECEFEKLTVEKICKRANVSVGTFYHHYRNKYDIMEEIFHRADDFFQEKMLNNQIKGKTAIEKIIGFFDLLAQIYTRYGLGFSKALFNTRNNLFVNDKRIMVTMLRDILVQGVEDNQIVSDLTAEELKRILFTTARGIVFDWCLRDGDFSLEKAMHQYILLVVRAVAP